MLQKNKIFWPLLAASAYSVVLSVKPLHRIYPALLNEISAVVFWMSIAAFILLRQAKLRAVAEGSKSALLMFCLFIVAVLVQYASGHSVIYSGIVFVHIGGALACLHAILAGGVLAEKKVDQLSAAYFYVGWGLVFVALAQSFIGWLQYLELHLVFGESQRWPMSQLEYLLPAQLP